MDRHDAQTEDAAEQPRGRAAAALRRLGHALMGHEGDDDLLLEVADAADRVARQIESQPPRERDLLELKRRMFDIDVADGEPVVHFDECFVSGPWNPMGIAIEVHRDGDDAVAEVTLGPAFEGAPGRSHGGIVAAIFDDVLGYLLTLRHQPGFTGELSVRYHAPTPIGQPLVFRAQMVGREGRKLWTAAEATADRQVVATATGTFIAIGQGQLRS